MSQLKKGGVQVNSRRTYDFQASVALEARSRLARPGFACGLAAGPASALLRVRLNPTCESGSVQTRASPGPFPGTAFL